MMDEETKGRVSQLLSEASRLLSSPNTSINLSTATNSGNAANNSNTVNSLAATAQPTIRETLRRAQGMLRESASTGLCRRLNRQERLRAASGCSYQRDKPAKRKAKEKKALEFAVLRCCNTDDLEEVHHLKWDSVIASGMLMLEEGDNESTIRNALKESLKAKLPLLGANDFDFVKVRHKTVSTLQLGPGTEYNYTVVEKMAGQGLLYVKIKQGYEFVYNAEAESDEELLKSAFASPSSPKPTNIDFANRSIPAAPAGMEQEVKAEIQSSDMCTSLQACGTAAASGMGQDGGAEIQISAMPGNQEEENQGSMEVSNGDVSAAPVPSADQLIKEIHTQGLSDPVEILRFLQKKMVQGRDLDVTSESELHEGDTNYICIDRHDILKTTFAELACIENFNITFEVDFMGEKAKDLGGPRKEWIRLINVAIKEKYFDNGLREYLCDDYYYVGIMMGIALFQNGQLPNFMPVDITEKLLTSPSESCIANLQRGLDVFGLTKIIQEVPILLHLLTPTKHKLAVRMLLNLLTPEFSEEGSTAYLREKKVYALFVKYMREVSSGRRGGITLSDVLIFVTAAAEEPVLGFTLHPSITFISSEPPKVNVCLYSCNSQLCSQKCFKSR